MFRAWSESTTSTSKSKFATPAATWRISKKRISSFTRPRIFSTKWAAKGLNRLISRFFNEFRKLSNDPDSEAVRQSVREATQAMVNDFHRIRTEVIEVQKHIDARIEGHRLRDQRDRQGTSPNSTNGSISSKLQGGQPNDLLDRAIMALKKLAHVHGYFHAPGQGRQLYRRRQGDRSRSLPGPSRESFSASRGPADDQGKPVNVSISRRPRARARTSPIEVKGGKIGALLEVRDRLLSTVRAASTNWPTRDHDAVNEIHQQGFTRDGTQGVSFFKKLGWNGARRRVHRAIGRGAAQRQQHRLRARSRIRPATTASPIAISGLQRQRLMDEGTATLDDYYNSIVSDVGVTARKNEEFA